MQYQLLYSKRFTRQYRKLSHSGNKYILLALDDIMMKLERGEDLPIKNRNHRLTGNMADFYEYHVLSDWLLIYRIHSDILVLELIATGTHSELFK